MKNRKDITTEGQDDIHPEKGDVLNDQRIKNFLMILHTTNKGLIANNQEEENKKQVITVCIPMIEETYKNLENIGGNSSQLQECRRNTEEYIKEKLEQPEDIDAEKLYIIRQLSRGERYLFSTTSGKIIKMELGSFKEFNPITNKRDSENFMNSNKLQKGDGVIRLHIDQGANLTEMPAIIDKMKSFLDTYKPKDKIRYGVLYSRLQSSDFIEYYRRRLKENTNDKTSNIIKVYDEMKNYIAKQGKLGNNDISGYNEFKETFILKDTDPNKPSTLNQALVSYEKEGKRLKEGCIIIDLDKLQKMMLYNR